MGVIRKPDFDILDLTITLLQRTWNLEWKDVRKSDREIIVEISEAVLIGFCGGIR